MSNKINTMPDATLVTWAREFSQGVTASPASYFILPEQAQAVAEATASYVAAYDVWHATATRTPSNAAVKQAMRVTLVKVAGYLANVINTNPLVTDAQRRDLGLTARRKPSRVPAPATAPVIEVRGVNGTVVKLGVKAADGLPRPRGVIGVGLYTFIGDKPTEDVEAWTFRGNPSRGRFDLPFTYAQSGRKVWITAYWYTRTGLHGKGCTAVGVNLPLVEAVPSPGLMGKAAPVKDQPEAQPNLKVA